MQPAQKTAASAIDFRLSTHWQFRANVDDVWKILSTPEQWPMWWPAVLAVQTMERGDDDGVGAYRHMTWRTALPYTLSFNMRTVRVVKRKLIEGLSDGNLAGRGCWQLFDDGAVTRVQYDWEVAVTKPWMRTLAPLLRRVFAWNHGVVMEWGRRGLIEELGSD